MLRGWPKPVSAMTRHTVSHEPGVGVGKGSKVEAGWRVNHGVKCILGPKNETMKKQ